MTICHLYHIFVMYKIPKMDKLLAYFAESFKRDLELAADLFGGDSINVTEFIKAI